MPQESLNDADVDPILQEVRGEAVTQRVRPDPLGDAGRLRRFDDDAMELPGTDRFEGMLSGEQPSVAMDHALPMTDLPPLAQQAEQIGRQHRVAISSALAAFDPK